MADSRKLIAITPENPVNDENSKIESMLKAGWWRIHIRHPHASGRDIRNIIESIKPQYHDRIVMHGHFDLSFDFNLGGLHLNHRCPTPPVHYSGNLSKSCHSISEITSCEWMMYVTLSPIFDSISKSGYISGFSPYDLRSLDTITTPVIALGGISQSRFEELKDYNFMGYAMLGDIPWDKSPESVSEYARYCISKI